MLTLFTYAVFKLTKTEVQVHVVLLAVQADTQSEIQRFLAFISSTSDVNKESSVHSLLSKQTHRRKNCIISPHNSQENQQTP